MRFLYLLFLFGTIGVNAQKVVDVNAIDRVDQSMFQVVNGEPFVNVKFVRLVEGTPYLSERWMKGDVISRKGYIYKNGMYKLDLIDGELHFMDNGIEKIAGIPVQELRLTDTIERKQYHFRHSSDLSLPQDSKKGWYNVLATGDATLLQYFDKKVRETKPYGSATFEQRIETSEVYYLSINETTTQIKKPKDPVSVFPHHQQALTKYWSTTKGSTADRLKALTEYYNSL